jgi:CBS domain-containing protein
MYEFIYYRVRDAMTSNPITADKNVSLSQIEVIFENHDFNAVPIIDEGNRLIGVITKLDFLKAFIFTKDSKVPDYESLMNRAISLVMNKKPHVVSLDTPLTRVLQSMVETGYKSFPVVENDLLVGIISREDIIRALKRGSRVATGLFGRISNGKYYVD